MGERLVEQCGADPGSPRARRTRGERNPGPPTAMAPRTRSHDDLAAALGEEIQPPPVALAPFALLGAGVTQARRGDRVPDGDVRVEGSRSSAVRMSIIRTA